MFALMSAPTGDAPPTTEPDDSIGALALINVPVLEPKAPDPPPLLEAMGAFTLINDPTTEPPSVTVPDDSTGALTLTNVPELGPVAPVAPPLLEAMGALTLTKGGVDGVVPLAPVSVGDVTGVIVPVPPVSVAAVTGVTVALAALPTSSVGTAAVRAVPAAGDA